MVIGHQRSGKSDTAGFKRVFTWWRADVPRLSLCGTVSQTKRNDRGRNKKEAIRGG